jgi:uncharacterized protein (DUF488 family)
MVKKGMLTETSSHFTSVEKIDYLKKIKSVDTKILLEIKHLYGEMNSNSLMKHTYINFPYWAINSVKAKELLNDVQFEKVLNSKPKIKETILFTIGYEGISLEEYINRLLINDIKVLVDVRRNPLSMKYGFNKNQMKRYCENLGIEYVHFPEVGIQSEQRQQLNNQKDYDKLFDYYRNNNLIKNFEAQSNILALLKDHKRIALTCFEANICQCHRKHLAEAIENLPEFKYEIKHI